MSTDPGHPPSADPGVEQEVDFGRYWRLIAARWWLPVAGLVAGLVIGYLASLGAAGPTYEATAKVYLGTPFAPGTSQPVTTPPTTLGLISSLLESDATLRRVAAKVGMKESRLRNHVTMKPIPGITNAKVGTPAPLLAITVDGSAPKKIVAAADELARIVVVEVSKYTDTRIQTLKATLALNNERLANVTKRSDVTQRQVEQLLNVSGLSGSEKLIASLNLNNLLQYLESRQASLEQSKLAINQALSLANDIERGRVYSPPVAEKAAGPSSRTGAAIGGLIGLIVGVLAALLWDPIAVRMRPRGQ